MLNIYIGKNNIPDNLEFVYDPEELSVRIDLDKDIVSRFIVYEIEGGTVVNSNVFKDRFGVGMYAEALSSTSKILLLLTQTDYLINASELGSNGICLLNHMTSGNAYFNSAGYDFNPDEYPVSINGNVADNWGDFFELLAEV